MRVTCVLASATSVGCASGAPMRAGAESDSLTVPLRRLPEITGDVRVLTGIYVPRREVVHTDVRWAALWHDLRQSMVPAGPVPRVNFDYYMLLFAAAGSRKNDGYSIDIAAAYIRRDSLFVVVHTRCPVPVGGVGYGQFRTAPIDVALVPRSTRPLSFVEETSGKC